MIKKSLNYLELFFLLTKQGSESHVEKVISFYKHLLAKKKNTYAACSAVADLPRELTSLESLYTLMPAFWLFSWVRSGVVVNGEHWSPVSWLGEVC